MLQERKNNLFHFLYVFSYYKTNFNIYTDIFRHFIDIIFGRLIENDVFLLNQIKIKQFKE